MLKLLNGNQNTLFGEIIKKNEKGCAAKYVRNK